MSPVKPPKHCSECGKVFSPTSNVQKRCPKCQEKAVKTQKATKPCKVCGTLFYAKKNHGRIGVVCSTICRNSLNGRKKRTYTYPEQKCLHCATVFAPKSEHAKYCDDSCQGKASRLRNIDAYRERDRKKVRKQTLGLHIRDETLGQPNKQVKWLWDGEGKWSVKFWPDITECLECNTTVYRHNSNGVCERCYDQMRPRDPEEVKKWRKKAYDRAREKGKIFSGQQARNWIKSAQKREIPVTPKIQNILENIERM